MIIVVKLIGTKGALDKPETEYAVRHLEDAAERAKQMILESGKNCKDCGWSVIRGSKDIEGDQNEYEMSNL